MITLCKNGKTEYKIYLCAAPSPSQEFAARELAGYLQKITGAAFEICPFTKTPPEKAILLGINGGEEFSDEDYHILTAGETLFIRASGVRGCLYGVYGFLEEVCGCRFFAPGCEKIPELPQLTLPGTLDIYRKPAFIYRETFYHDSFDGSFAVKRCLNGMHMRLDMSHGGKVSYAKGYFVHSFSRLVPPEKYHEEHPEYFALRNGVRENENAQLCLSNPEVLRIATQKALEDLRAEPTADIISISQNDGSQPCQCPECQAVAREEGSESGPILRFVNKIAEEIEKEFPGVLVDTLAYDYSRKPPLITRPRGNVIIRLCSFECCFSHGLDDCRQIADAKKRGTPPEFADFAGDVEKWSELTDRLFIWDYVTNFEFYQLPHPNLHVLAGNLRFFKKNGALGVFEQGNGQSSNGDMAELRTYLLAKLLWDPQTDEKACAREFTDAWFGPAASEMRSYIDLMKNAVLESGWHLSLYDPPSAPHLTRGLLDTLDKLFDRAESIVASDAELLRRVRKERLGIRFARFFIDPPDENRLTAAEKYIKDAKTLGVKRFSEKWGTENIRRLALRGVWPPLPEDMTVIRD